MPTAPKSPQFLQHPVALGGRLLLNAFSYIAEDILPAPAPDVFLFGPPPATDVDSNGGSVMREISRATTVFFHSVGTTAILATDKIQLVYKAEGGREVVLIEEAALHNPGSFFVLPPDCSFVMGPNDVGLFMRIVQAVPLVGPKLDVTVQSFDVRGLRRVATDVTAVQVIAAPGGNVSAADLVYENTTENVVDVLFSDNLLGAYAAIHNYDDIAHHYQLFVTDGVRVIELSTSFAPGAVVAANSTASFIAPALPPGWGVFMSLGEAVHTFAPRCILSPFQTNLDVARNDQAGAY